MKTKYVLIIVFFGVILLALLVFFLKECPDNELILKGNDIVLKIEDYKLENGRLPNSLEELGIESNELGPLYYNKWDSVNYMVWYGTSLGESITYYSDSKKWEKYARGMGKTKP